MRAHRLSSRNTTAVANHVSANVAMNATTDAGGKRNEGPLLSASKTGDRVEDGTMSVEDDGGSRDGAGAGMFVSSLPYLPYSRK